MADENFQRAKNLLLQAVDTVIEVVSTPHVSQERVQAVSHPSTTSTAPLPSRSSTLSRPSRHSTGSIRTQSSNQPSSLTLPGSSNTSSSSSLAVKEHRRIFGYKPLKGKGPSKKGKSRAAKPKQWRKDCICLCDCEQTWKPSSEEKIELARIGLGLRSNIMFDINLYIRPLQKDITDEDMKPYLTPEVSQL